MQTSVLQFGCASARSRKVLISGLELHVLEWGKSGHPPLCFVHGGSAHAHWFDAVAPRFADRFHVVSLDQRGHGRSAWPKPPAYASEDFAGDLAGLMDALGWTRMTLVGHSMGGHNSMAFGAWYPDRLDALVLVDGRPGFTPERLRLLRDRGARPMGRYASPESAVSRFRLIPRDTVADPALLGHIARMGLVQRDGAWLYRFDPACSSKRQPADCWPLLPRITAPTLIVRGEWSPVLSRDAAERMRETIPRATLVEIPGTYHHLILDAPGAFCETLEAFLASVTKA